MATAAELAIQITAKDQASGPLGNVNKQVDDLGKKAGQTATPLNTMKTGLGEVSKIAGGFVAANALTSLPGLLIDMAKGAAEDEASMGRLQRAVENAEGAFEPYQATIAKAIENGQKLAFSDDQTRDALSLLTAETGDADEALRRLSLAQDLSRGTGMDLVTAAKLLGRVSDENTSVLSRYGIVVKEGADAQDLLNQVDAKFGGQAATFAESDAAKMQIMADKVGELQEQIGAYLIPVLAAVVGGVIAFTDGLSGVVSAAQPVVDVIASFVKDNLEPLKVGLAAIAAVIIASVIPALVSMVVAALPIIAILAAVGAAAALLYAAWDSNFLGIRDITMQVIDFLKPYIMEGIASIVSTVQTGIGIVRAVWDEVFPYIKAVVETVFPIIAQVVTTYIAILQKEIELGVAAAKWAFDNVFVPIQGVVSDVFTTIAGIVTTVWGPTVTAIGVGVDTVKTIFDGIVVIQGIISDVFTTISGLVSELWNSGAVLMIANGVGTIKGIFADIYSTMYGFGRDLVQGLIDGIVSLFGTLSDWVSKIGDLLVIDVPGFSPPYDAGYKQGRSFIEGLTTGLISGYGQYGAALGAISGGMGGIYGGGSGAIGGGQGSQYGSAPGGRPGGSYGGGTGGRGGGRPGDPGYVGPGIIGDPAFGNVGPDLYNNGGISSGGGKRFGSMSSREIEDAVARGVKRGLGGAI